MCGRRRSKRGINRRGKTVPQIYISWKSLSVVDGSKHYPIIPKENENVLSSASNRTSKRA